MEGIYMKTNESKIEANKVAWGKIAQDHYNYFKELLSRADFKLNPVVEEELGDVLVWKYYSYISKTKLLSNKRKWKLTYY
jgi:hypothetical protein